MDTSMRTHVSIIAWINIICGVPGLLIGLLVTLGIMAPALVVPIALPFVALFGILVIGYAALGVLVGVGLLQGAEWSRILAIILTIFHLINVGTLGVSTLFGIYSLYVLFHRDTERLFRRGF